MDSGMNECDAINYWGEWAEEFVLGIYGHGPVKNKTEYPNTPKNGREIRQAIYAMRLWILQHDMGLTFEDAQILLATNGIRRVDILKKYGIDENSQDYEEKRELLEYYRSTLEEKYGAELEIRAKRFSVTALESDIANRFGRWDVCLEDVIENYEEE